MIIKYLDTIKTLFTPTFLSALLIAGLLGAGSARAFDPTSEVVLDPDSGADGRLFATPIGSDSIFELDINTGVILNRFPAPQPFNGSVSKGMAFDGTTVFYFSDDSGLAATDDISGTTSDLVDLYALDPDTGEVLWVCPVPRDPGAHYDGLGVLDVEVYLLDARNNAITAVDSSCNGGIRRLDFAGSNPGWTLLEGGLSGDGVHGMLIGAATDSSGDRNVVEIDPFTGVANTLFPFPFSIGTLLGAAVLPDERLALGGLFQDGHPLKMYDRSGNDLGPLDSFGEEPFSSLAGDYPFDEIAAPPPPIVIDVDTTNGGQFGANKSNVITLGDKGTKSVYIVIGTKGNTIDPVKDVLLPPRSKDNAGVPMIGDPKLGKTVPYTVKKFIKDYDGDGDRKNPNKDLRIYFSVSEMEKEGAINSDTKDLTVTVTLQDGTVREGTVTVRVK